MRHKPKNTQHKNRVIQRRPFSKTQLLIYLLIFAGVGYLVFRSFAAGATTKVWDTDADWNTGAKNNVAVNNGSVALAGTTSGGSGTTIPTYEFHVEPNNYDPTSTIEAGQGFMWNSYTSSNRDAITTRNGMRVNGQGNSAIAPTSNYSDEWWVSWQDYFPSNNTHDANAGGWMKNFHNAPGDIGWTLSGTGVSGVSSLATKWDPSTNWYSVNVLAGYTAEQRTFNIYQPSPNSWHTIIMHVIWGRVENGVTPKKGLIQVWVDGNNTPAVDTRSTAAVNTGQAYPNGISTIARPSYGPYTGQLQQYVMMYEGGPYNLKWHGSQPAVHQSTAMLYGPTLAQMLNDKEAVTGQWGGILIPGSPVVEPGHPDAYSFAVTSRTSSQLLIPSSLTSQAGATGSTTYPSSGSIILTHDAGQTVDWASATAGETKPAGTNITYSYQTSPDNASWSNPTSDITTLANGRYLKVTATLSTTNNTLTPSLDKLTVAYDAVSVTPPPSNTPPTGYQFGNYDTGSNLAAISADKKRGSTFTAPKDADLTDIYAYLSGNGTAGTQAVKAGVYDASSGVPTTLLGASAEQQISGTATGTFVRFSLVPAVHVNAGQNYTLTLLSGATNALVQIATSPTGGFTVNDDTYSDGFANPFGAATSDPRGISFYAVGTAGAPPDQGTPVLLDSTIKNGQTLSGKVDWTVTASGDIASVEFWANGKKLSTDNTMPYSYTLDTTQLTDGVLQLGINLFDSNGTKYTQGTGGVYATVTINNTVPAKQGDLNNDNKVDIQDLSMLLAHFGQSGLGDINGDGTVNIVDLSILMSNFGK